MTAGFRALGPLRHPAFAAYAAGHLVSQAGFWTQQVGLGWLAWELARSESWLGVIAFCQFAPAVALALFAGVATDRADRLRLALATQLAAALVAALLFALVVAEAVGIGGLAGLALLSGAVGSVGMPVKRVLVSVLVPREDLAAAVSVNAVTLNIGRFVGPAIAGALIAGPGVAWCFALNGLGLALFVLLLAWLRRRHGGMATPDGAAPAAAAPRVLGAIAEGLRYAAREPRVRAVLLLYAAYALFGRPLVDLLPAIAGALHGGGPETLAALFQAFAVGAGLAGVALFYLASASRVAWLLGLAFPALGAGAAAVVAPHLPFAAALAGMALFGVGQVTANVASQTLLQLQAPDALRGRVVALHFLTFRAGAAIGGLALGAVAEVAGSTATFLAAAAVLVAAGLAFPRRAATTAVAPEAAEVGRKA